MVRHILPICSTARLGGPGGEVTRSSPALLSGDRRMVMDDVVSTRLTLNQGKNIIRGAVINGPGMSDFCVRFLDEKGHPIKDLTISYE